MVRGSGAVFVAWLATGCAKPLDTGVVLTPSTLSTADPTVCERLLARAREPRALDDAASTSGRVAISHACVDRLGRDTRSMLAGPPGRVPRFLPPAARSEQSVSPCSVAPRLDRLPLESFRRDHPALGAACRF